MTSKLNFSKNANANLSKSLKYNEKNNELIAKLQSCNSPRKKELIQSQILAENDGLINKLCIKFSSNLLDDLRQEASMELLRCAEKYTIGKAAKFSTYAAASIDGAIKKFVNRKSKIVTVPEEYIFSDNDPSSDDIFSVELFERELDKNLNEKNRGIICSYVNLDDDKNKNEKELILPDNYQNFNEMERLEQEELINMIKNDLGAEDFEFIYKIYSGKIPKELAKEKNISVQAISKRKRKIEKKMKEIS